MKYLFEESQRFTQWWLWVILLSFPIISFGPFDENPINWYHVLIGLGIPFNIASTSLLTIMLAHLSGYKAGSVRLCIGDAHVYENHYEAVLKQIKRTPYPFPTISIEDDPKTHTTGLNLHCQ